ncbi:MAG TPA: hypothetical protein PK299_12760 [Anaerolineales bacterium]|nr:hypothetical protein [Anaerolineales bacterium]
MENQSLSQTMTVKDWLVTFLISAIPLVGIIMMFVWAFNGSTNLNKTNWAKAGLLMIAIIFGIYLLFFVVLGGLIFGGSMSN